MTLTNFKVAVRRCILAAAITLIASCGGGTDGVAPDTASARPVALRSSVGAETPMIRSFVIDGYSRVRLADMNLIGALLDRAVAANANTICFTYNLPFDTTGHVLDTAVMWGVEDTALRPADLIPVIRLARSKGLDVMIKPQTTIYDASGPIDMGNVQKFFVDKYPSFNVDHFFTDYTARLAAFAAMAESEGVKIFSVGTESDGLDGPQRDAQWRSVIAAVRARFTGLLTYGASVRFYQTDSNAIDFRKVTFWDALDMVGLSVYAGWGTLPGKFADHEPMALFSRVQWNASTPVYDLKTMIDPVLQKYGKKLFLEEFAFQGTPDQLQTGYDVRHYSMLADQIGPPDYANQAKAYEYFLQYFLTAFDEKVAGFNPWVLNGAPWILSAAEVPKWRISQFLVIGESDGSLFSKPALETIGQFYAGARWNDVVAHRPLAGTSSKSGGPFRDVFYRAAVANPNTSAATSVAFNGGSNLNTVVLPGPRADYSVRVDPDGVRVWRTGGTSLYADHFALVQRLQFSDESVAFDLDGQAGSVAKILAAVFGADATANKEYVGIGLSLAAQGRPQRELLAYALAAKLGAQFSNDAMVDLFFANIVSRPPTIEERRYYTGLVQSGALDQMGLAHMATETPANVLNARIGSLATTGLAYRQ